MTPADPYRPPASEIGPPVAPTADPEVVALRQQHVRHERAVRTLGLFLYVLAACQAASLVESYGRATFRSGSAAGFGYAVSAVGIVAFLIKLGRDLRQLRTWARRVVLGGTIAILMLGLAVVFVEALRPGGSLGGPAIAALLYCLILGYVISLVGSDRGVAVSSEPYRAAVAATPELDPRASLVVKLIFGLLMTWAGIVFALSISHLVIVS